jgi:hypothetical protein
MLTPLVGISHSYRITSTILTTGLTSVVKGGKLSDLHCPVRFFDYQPLQQLFAWLYCWALGMDERAESILKDNAARIFKAIMAADPERMGRLVDLESDFNEWGKESSARVRQGKCFDIHEGIFRDIDDKEYADVTAFKMDSDGGYVKFAQLYSSLSPCEERDQCVLGVSLVDLKRACLRAYIELEKEAGRDIDLKDLDLTWVNLDQPLTKLLLDAGADRQQVLLHYVRSQQENGEKNVDLTLFDVDKTYRLRPLDIDDPCWRPY